MYHNTDGLYNKLITVLLPIAIGFLLLPEQIRNALAPGHPTSLRFVGQSAHLLPIKFLHNDRPVGGAKVPSRVPGTTRGLRPDAFGLDTSDYAF